MTYAITKVEHFLQDLGVKPEELNSRKFLKEFKKKNHVKVHDIPPTQPKSWDQIKMLLFNFESYSVPLNLVLNPTLKLLYICGKEFNAPNMENIPGTPHRILITDAVL